MAKKLMMSTFTFLILATVSWSPVDACTGVSLSTVSGNHVHGTGHPTRETLLASDEWQAINERFGHWSDRPEFHLDA